MTDKQDDNVEVFIDEMRRMSKFVYNFANMRSIVRKHHGPDGKKTGKFLWFFGEEKEHHFDTPALIITQDGAQDGDDNIYLKYPITPDAILKFVDLNRKKFKEPEGGGYLLLDEKEEDKSEPFPIEVILNELKTENFKIVDYDDDYTDEQGGLVYAVILNLTQKWVSVVFRGTVGLTDMFTDRDFSRNTTSFFESKDYVFVEGNEPGTHNGFTEYLFSERCEGAARPYVDRILACINDQFGSSDVVGDDWKLYVSGHSLGGGLANLFGFRVAQLKAKNDPRVSNLPPRVKVMSFAAPCVGDEGYDKECQYLEEKNILRHIRISNEGDIVPTNNFPIPFSLAIKGNTSLYKQNGVNIFLKSGEKMEIAYGNTKGLASQFGLSSVTYHLLPEYGDRMDLDHNKEDFNQTVEELYKTYKPVSA